MRARAIVTRALACAVIPASACLASSPAAFLEQEEVLVLEVAPDLVPCVGEMAGRCIQVRRPGAAEWTTFYDPIEGFQREDGVRYTLEVGRRSVANPPADGSAWVYRLIRIVSSEPTRWSR